MAKKYNGTYFPADQMKCAPNIGFIKITPVTVHDNKKKHIEPWLTDTVKRIDMYQISDQMDDEVAINSLGKVLTQIDPNKFKPEEYDFDEIEIQEAEKEIDPDIMQTMEQMFYKYVQVNNIVNASLILPPILYIAEQYNDVLYKVYPYDDDLAGKVYPIVIAKLMLHLPNKDIPVYRISFDTEIIKTEFTNKADGSVGSFIVPNRCSKYLDLISYSDYNYIKKENICLTTESQ